jgi:ABC-type molybdate transport system permease subunit
MLEPTTFPRAMSGYPFNADLTLTISSGAEVANETTVIPMTIFGMLRRNDNATAASNSQSPPLMSKNKPTQIAIKSI